MQLHRQSNGDEPQSADYLNKVRVGGPIRINSGGYRWLGTDATRSIELCTPEKCCVPEPWAFVRRPSAQMLPLTGCIVEKK